LGLVAVFAVLNFGIGISQALYQPFVLSFASRDALGVISSCGGLGMLTGSLLLATWGGPRRRIHGVLGGILVVGLAHVLLGVLPSVPLLAAALFGILFAAAIVNGSNAAILMAKVAPEVQGRVFAALTMVAWSTLPLAYLAAGPLADHVFEPLLAADGPLAGSVGALTGAGAGRGMGLMLALTGVLLLATGIVGYLVPRIREIEE
jgi:hypothetical protein